MTSRHRRKRGVSLIETVAGMAIAIPVVLFIVDAVAMVIAQIAHDHLAKDCARAASEEEPANMGLAINNVISRFNNPMLVVDSNTFNVVYDGTTAEIVRVQTTSTFTLPVPVPFLGMDKQTFVAEATEPIVSVPSK
ncbi:MAG: hypothetical protein K2X93_15865 [Candidatus Obscuribacterales bacterium]|nr:hypothetical protein [Candidatus Obscuribacterales bacterium]